MNDIETTISEINEIMAAVAASEPPTTLLVRRDIFDAVSKLWKRDDPYYMVAQKAVDRFNKRMGWL